jgi:hypothetical protein
MTSLSIPIVSGRAALGRAVVSVTHAPKRRRRRSLLRDDRPV